MIPKGITKWPTQVATDSIPLNYDTSTHPQFALDLAITPANKFKTDFHIEVIIFCFVFEGTFNPTPPLNYSSNKLFEFSTSSKFRFSNPAVESATIQLIYNCMVSAIDDFNSEISKLQSKLVKHIDYSGDNIQYITPILAEKSKFILDIWNMRIRAN